MPWGATSWKLAASTVPPQAQRANHAGRYHAPEGVLSTIILQIKEYAMPPAKGRQSDQSKRFIDAPRELCADQYEEAFGEKLQRVAWQKSKHMNADDKADSP
jgi:hypothetical protein